MCGINGYWDLKRRQKPEILRNKIEQMNQEIIYRGPDEQGIFQEESLCMGMRRLAILDVKGGSQPVFNEDRTLAVIYNGEIYNFREIKKELENKGHHFRTRTDTEVIVHAFEEYGTEAFDLLDGMYAFSLYDSKEKILYLVRDRMGEKPLYYYVDKEKVIFGSELKCLMVINEIPKKINIRALNQYLQLTYIPAPLTIYEDIYKLRPGHYLKLDGNGNIEDSEYWNLPVKRPKVTDYKKSVNHLRGLIKKSVKQRMVSDVPIGAFLSGGVDSGSIVGLMSRISKKAINTFTVGSDIREYDERFRAKKIVKKNKTYHRERIIDYSEFLKTIEKIIKQMDEPFADSSELPTYLLSEFVKDYVKVVLTGDAGDEVFAGYNKYLSSYYTAIYKKIPKAIRKSIVEQGINLFSDTNRLVRKIRKVVENSEEIPCERHKALMCMGIKRGEINELLKHQYYDEQSLDFINDYYNEFSDATDLQKALYTDLKVVLEGDMLVKVDRMSMQNSIETRVPMLAREVVEFVINLPDEFKIKGKYRKRILKDAMKDVLPSRFERYPKHGFEIPVDHWLRNEMKEEVKRLFSHKHIEKQGLFQYEYVQRLMDEHFTGKRNRKDELWVLYIFEKWYEEVM